MSNLTDYNLQLEAIMAVPEKDVKQPNMPIGLFVQESENTCKRCLMDRDQLIAKGLDWKIVDNLKVSLGALREGQSRWIVERREQEEAGKSWAVKAPAAYDLRDRLIHDFRYAFRKDPALLSRVSAIADGTGHADMIQDLNDLSYLGKQNAALLTPIKFDNTLLEVAADSSAELGELLAIVNGTREEHSEIKTIRDKAYTICKADIDELRACGQYTFWREPEIVKAYASEYIRRKNQNANNNTKEDDPKEPSK
jgi:hypothetical protein